MTEIPKGLCQCGCGGKTRIAPYSHSGMGWVKGEPLDYLNHHYSKVTTGDKNPSWNGGRYLLKGYVLIRNPDHPRAFSNGYVPEHILIAERAMGKPLPSNSQVHHVNGKKGDNSRGNHVVCQDDAYHQLLHKRKRAYDACGHASWLKCKFCHEYDDPSNIVTVVYRGRSSNHHKICRSKYGREYRSKKRGF